MAASGLGMALGIMRTFLFCFLQFTRPSSTTSSARRGSEKNRTNLNLESSPCSPPKAERLPGGHGVSPPGHYPGGLSWWSVYSPGTDWPLLHNGKFGADSTRRKLLPTTKAQEPNRRPCRWARTLCCFIGQTCFSGNTGNYLCPLRKGSFFLV